MVKNRKDEIDSKVATNVTVNYVKSERSFASSEDGSK